MRSQSSEPTEECFWRSQMLTPLFARCREAILRRPPLFAAIAALEQLIGLRRPLLIAPGIIVR